MYRSTASVVRRVTQQNTTRPFALAKRSFAGTRSNEKSSENSTPGWKGRTGDDHVLNRDKNDVQGKASNEAREQREKGQEGSGAISQKDENNSTQKAREEHPEAPKGPIIGMQDGKLTTPS